MAENKSLSSVSELISEPNLKAYSVRFDVDDLNNPFYDLKEFVNALMYELPDFAHGGEYWPGATPSNPIEAVNEAAKSIYQIREFREAADLYLKGGSLSDRVWERIRRRGEFGELILFFLLRHFNGAIPLLSKIYFKDSDGFAVHGFDAVHYHEETDNLWLGESKCYESSEKGLDALLADTKEHFKSDYLDREFALVAKKMHSATLDEEKRQALIERLNGKHSLKDILSGVTIPLLCTFSSPSLAAFNEESEEFVESFKKEMYGLREYYDTINDHPLKSRLNIVLLLMPVRSKKDLVSSLHKRLVLAQGLVE